MSQKDLKKIHELLMENVREENEKNNKEFSNSIFNKSSNKNLITAAKEALKPKNLKQQKIKINDVPIKINRSIGKNVSKLPQYEKTKKYNILSDKQYLNLMLNDLKQISTSIKRKQNRFNPSNYTENSILSKEKRKYFNKNNSHLVSKNGNSKIINLKMKYNIKNKNYNMVNLLTQIIGDQTFNENNITENNNYFKNLHFDNEEQKLYVE